MDENTQQPQQQVPLQPIQQASEATPKKSFLPKILLIILGVTIVLGLIGGAYYLGTQKSVPAVRNGKAQPMHVTNTVTVVPTSIPTATADLTANWKTYKNRKYNYTLKYPSALEIAQQDLQSAPYSVLFYKKQTQPGAPGFPSLYVSVIPEGFTNTGSVIYNFMPQNFIDKALLTKVNDVIQYGVMSTEWNNYKKLPDTSVAGLIATTIENDNVWEGGNGLKDRRVFIKKNGFTYMIGTYSQTVDDLNNYHTFLSSFQFVQ